MTYVQFVGISNILLLLIATLSGTGAQRRRETTTVADQYDSIVAYDAPDGQVLYFYETRRGDVCRPIPDFGSGAMPFGVGYNYFHDQPVTWSRLVAGSYECADECYRGDCKEFKIVQPFYSGRGRRPQMTCHLLWKGCFVESLEAPVVAGSAQGETQFTGEVIKFDKQRIYKPNALYTYFTKHTTSYCGGPGSGDLFSGGLSGYSAESCASQCLFYATKICAAFAFDAKANRCFLKSINCTAGSIAAEKNSVSKVEGEEISQRQNSETRPKLEFYVRKPWLSEKYEFQDLIRFDQTECTNTLPGPTVNFSRPDEPANVCKKDANCAGFQCFQYCREENMPTPWECSEWDPDVQKYECSFVLKTSACLPGINSVPSRRSFLFVRHDFVYTRPFIPPEFYHRLRRSTTTQRPKKLWRVNGARLEDDEDKIDAMMLRHLRRIRKAHRMRRLHRLAMGDSTGDKRIRRRLARLRQAIRERSANRQIRNNDKVLNKLIS